MTLVALGLVLTPGPNMAYLVSRSVALGRRAGLVSLLGVATGFLVYLLAAVAGIATLFSLVPAVYQAVKLAGAAYLGWLAWRALRPGGESVFAPRGVQRESAGRLFLMGLLTNLLNPKIAVLYVSVLPQFVDPRRGAVPVQSFVLGLVQVCVAVAVNALIVLTAGSVASLLRRRPRWEGVQRRVTGLLLAFVAVRLAVD